MRRSALSLIAITIIVLTNTFLSGCTPTPDSSPITGPDADFTAAVSVTGKLLPARWSTISALGGGTVTRLLVKEGDVVAAGDPLIQLDDRDAQLALAQAETALGVAEAQLAQINVEPQAEAVAVAEAQVAAAQTAISQTLAQRALLDAGSYSTQLDSAKAGVAAAEAERFIANRAHDDAMKCYDVQQADGSNKRVCPTLGPIEEQTRMVMLAADAGLLAAQTQLRVLYRDHQAQIAVAETAIEAAQAQAEIAEAQLELLVAPVSPEAIAAASAVVDQARVAVEMAQLAIERTIVVAPIAGVAGNISTREGEIVSPGVPLMIIGDASTFRVETTDLDEIDVGQVALGQEAVITFEAIPDETFTGTVTYIAPMANPGSGGVNYTVYLALNTLHPQLRWGMTAFVDISSPD